MAQAALQLALGGLCYRGALDRPLRHHQKAQLGAGGQNAVEVDEVLPWPRQHSGCVNSSGDIIKWVLSHQGFQRQTGPARRRQRRGAP